MKEVRRIKFTGKNLNDVFTLPCVADIKKVLGMPLLSVYPIMLLCPSSARLVRPGNELVEYDNGLWKVISQPDEAPESKPETEKAAEVKP